ncbi:MAG: hypothetical protein Q4B04_04120 [bacterium]|nr:hypothetical protein [bacterium]
MHESKIKSVIKLFLYTTFAAVICAIVYIVSMTTFEGFMTQITGYTVYEQQENGKSKLVSEITLAEGQTGSDIELEENQIKIQVRSEMSTVEKIITKVITQAILLIIFYMAVFMKSGDIGRKQRFLEICNQCDVDKWLGLKIGLMASIPSALMYIVLVVCKFLSVNFLNIFKVYHSAFRPLVDWICNESNNINDVSILTVFLMIIPTILMPVISQLAYLYGYTNGQATQKIIYK